MLKFNRLTDLQGETGPETAGPVNCAVIQCLRINFATATANFHFIILHAKAKEHLPWHSALSRPTVRTRVGLSVRSTVGCLYIPGQWTSTYPAGGTAAFIVMHVTWMSGQILLDCSM